MSDSVAATGPYKASASASGDAGDMSVASSGTHQTRFSFYNAEDFVPSVVPRSPQQSLSSDVELAASSVGGTVAVTGISSATSNQHTNGFPHPTPSQQHRFNFYDAKQDVQAPQEKSSSVSIGDGPLTIRSVASRSSDGETPCCRQTVLVEESLDSVEILRSLQEHEQQRLEILSGPSLASSAKEYCYPSKVAGNQKQQELSNPYEDAIKEALQLLRKHRSNPDALSSARPSSPQSSTVIKESLQTQIADRLFDAQNRTFSSRCGWSSSMSEHDQPEYRIGPFSFSARPETSPVSQDAGVGADPSVLGEAYQAEIEARRKQRQERMARYASRLAELKQEATSSSLDASSIRNNHFAGRGPDITEDAITESPESFASTPWDERDGNRKNVTTRCSSSSSSVPLYNASSDHQRTRNNDSQGVTATFHSSRQHEEDPVQRGVERVLLAILARAHSRGRGKSIPSAPLNSVSKTASWQHDEEKKSNAEDRPEETDASPASSVEEAENDALTRAMSDLLGAGSKSSPPDDDDHNVQSGGKLSEEHLSTSAVETMKQLPEIQLNSNSKELSLCSASRVISTVKRAGTEPPPTDTMFIAVSSGSDAQETGQPDGEELRLSSACSGKGDNRDEKSGPNTELSDISDVLCSSVTQMTTEDLLNTSGGEVEAVHSDPSREKIGLLDEQLSSGTMPSPVGGDDQQDVGSRKEENGNERPAMASLPATGSYRQNGNSLDRNDDSLDKRVRDLREGSDASHTNVDMSGETTDDHEEDETIDDSLEDDLEDEDDESYTEEDDTDDDGAQNDTLDGVLGPLSNKAGGATGVILEVDSPGNRQHDVASPSLLDSLSAAMSLVTGAVTHENHFDRVPHDRYSSADDGDVDVVDVEASELMRTLCAHLLPLGVDHQSSRLLDKLPEWDESNPDEAGYRIIRLSRQQLQRVENAFEHMVRMLRQESAHNLERTYGSDEAFERDLEAAEELLEREEKRLEAEANVNENGLSRFSDSSAVLSTKCVDAEGLALPSAHEGLDGQMSLSNFPGVKPAGRGEMGDLEFFNLPVIFKSHVTGFEPTKDLYLEAGNIIAGQYLVEGELGSAAFSTAYRCVDLSSDAELDGHEEVCLKIIKNTKDFFDQSLDEIKILELLRQTGKCQEKCIVEMKTFFYHREHLVIVTELLRQNLFEFGKFIIDNDEEPYFTLPRLSYITRQVLVALDFVHHLGLVHSDVKPENILLGSYSRAQVKLIDFGSSCYLTDRQSSYIQSRSYRAPEVVLGLPYDGKIDIWSLGCVVAEMFTGEVTFQNDSIVSMLSRIEAICGPFPRHMVAQGRQSARYFTECGLLFEEVHPDDDTNCKDDSESLSDDGDGCRRRKLLDIFQPKITTLAARLGFDLDLMEHFDNGEKLSKEQKRQAKFVDFCRSLLAVDPDGRPTAGQALHHPWMNYASALTEEDIKYPSN